jgi:hypothetical protein
MAKIRGPEAALRELVLSELVGGLWHSTHPDRFKGILSSGAILPEPGIEDRDRWGASQGPDHYPYVRTLGGVSLFDFDQFDPESYSSRWPFSDWRTFIPYQQPGAVWIEIDRQKVGPPQLISRAELMAKWKTETKPGNIMPYIEAAHLGPLPRAAFRRAFLVREGDSHIHPQLV